MVARSNMNHLPKIICSVVPHKKQRYPTCGDYFEKKGDMYIVVSKMIPKGLKGLNYEFLVLIHELIEWYLIKQKGVTIKQVDDFDMAFEKNRNEGDISEPGNDPHAPYFNEHQFATKIEEELAKYMGVDWLKYNEYVDEL